MTTLGSTLASLSLDDGALAPRMAVVTHLPVGDTEAVVEEYNAAMTPAETVVLTLVNGPASCTISGGTWGVTTFCEAIEERFSVCRTRLLSVDAPFHSVHHLAGVADSAAASAARLPVHPANLSQPVFGPDGADLRMLPVGTDLVHEVAHAQLIRPGNFIAAVSSISATCGPGARVPAVLDFGPGPVASVLARQSLGTGGTSFIDVPTSLQSTSAASTTRVGDINAVMDCITSAVRAIAGSGAVVSPVEPLVVTSMQAVQIADALRTQLGVFLPATVVYDHPSVRLIAEHLPESPPMYPPDQLTDRSEQFLATEAIREKLMLKVQDELPYGLTVEIERWEPTEDGRTEISAVIWVERPGQKAIVIGEGGELLKSVGRAARLSLNQALGRRVHLELWVKVKENWADSANALKAFGYEGS